MAVAELNSTTLTNTTTADANVNVVVGSTTNIVAGDLLVFAGKSGVEVARVQSVPVSGQVNLMRGVAGTRARAQAAGTNIYIGSADDFKAVRDNAAALVGDSSSLPDYCIPGTRAVDGQGNEYVMVDLTFSGYTGAGVLISRDGLYTAAALADGNAGSVGVLAEEGTSDQMVWAQIYGYHPAVQLVGGSSLCTSTGILQPATSVSTPAVGILGQTTSQASSNATARIFGMYPAGATTTGTTSASSATGYTIPAWLNYPFVEITPSS